MNTTVKKRHVRDRLNEHQPVTNHAYEENRGKSLGFGRDKARAAKRSGLLASNTPEGSNG